MKQGCSGALFYLSAFCRGNETNRQMGFQVDKTFVPPATGTLHWRCLVFCGVVKGGGVPHGHSFLSSTFFSFLLIITRAIDWTACPTTSHRSRFVLHTFCHFSNRKSNTYFLVFATVIAICCYWGKSHSESCEYGRAISYKLLKILNVLRSPSTVTLFEGVVLPSLLRSIS